MNKGIKEFAGSGYSGPQIGFLCFTFLVPIVIHFFDKGELDFSRSFLEPLIVSVVITVGVAVAPMAKGFKDLRTLVSELNQDQDEIKKELKRLDSLVESSYSKINKAISVHLQIENSLIEAYGLHDDVGGHFRQMSKVYDKAGLLRVVNREAIPFSIKLLTSGLNGLERFFHYENSDGVFETSKAIELYSKLAESVNNSQNQRKILIVEPYVPKDLNEAYSSEYLDFLGTYESYIEYGFLGSEDENISSLEERYKIRTKYIDLAGQPGDNRMQELRNYSHLIFELNSCIISCSVLPIYSTTQLKDKETYNSNDFRGSSLVYLAFRSFDKGLTNGGDNIIRFIRMIRNRFSLGHDNQKAIAS